MDMGGVGGDGMHLASRLSGQDAIESVCGASMVAPLCQGLVVSVASLSIVTDIGVCPGFTSESRGVRDDASFAGPHPESSTVVLPE